MINAIRTVYLILFAGFGLAYTAEAMPTVISSEAGESVILTYRASAMNSQPAAMGYHDSVNSQPAAMGYHDSVNSEPAALTTVPVPVPQPALVTASPDSPALARLRQEFAREIMFRAELSHFFTDSFSGETTEVYGTIWFARDGYRIETPDQIIVVSGDVSTVLNIRQNRLILSHYDAEEDEFAPSRFFSRENDNYVSTDRTNPDGSTTIHIASDDPFDLFQHVEIRLNRDGNPVQIEAVDQMENTIRTMFRFGRFLPFDANQFTLTPPQGAEIVDLRD